MQYSLFNVEEDIIGLSKIYGRMPLLLLSMQYSLFNVEENIIGLSKIYGRMPLLGYQCNIHYLMLKRIS